MSERFAAICSSVSRPGRMSLICRSSSADRRGRAQLDLLLHRLVVRGEGRPFDVSAGAALHAQLALLVNNLAATDGVRGAALHRHALEDVEVDLLMMSLRRDGLGGGRV